jgi:predicted TIM-barrel fold metal-dependent hydrolase
VLVLAVPPIEEVGPSAIAAEFARLANDEMAELVQKHPDRFVGFACALPLNDPEASLREVDRAVGDLGALGAQVFTNVLGVPLDHPTFDQIFAYQPTAVTSWTLAQLDRIAVIVIDFCRPTTHRRHFDQVSGSH